MAKETSSIANGQRLREWAVRQARQAARSAARDPQRTWRRVKTAGKVAAFGAGVAAVGAGVAAGVTLGAAIYGVSKLRRGDDLTGEVALITGASRGLGLAIARELAAQGCKLVICARDQHELQLAAQDLSSRGATVLAIPCDIGERDQVERMVQQASERFGRIDLLVNNAGIITVGPLTTQTLDDYEASMKTMFWGVVYPTLALLPQMIARRGGRIANITSIGGKVSVPHLVPYNCAKFAAVGFSEGLHAEVARFGVRVTTVVPGLMRTGSHINAYFKGKKEAEYALFSLSATTPVVAMNARRAARTVVRAIRRGDAEIFLTPQARLAASIHGVAPGITSRALGFVNAMLPDAPAVGGLDRHLGRESENPISRSPLTALGRIAARDLNQVPSGGTAAALRDEPQAAAG